MRIAVPKLRLRPPALTPWSLRIILLVIGLGTIIFIVAFVPSRYDQTVDRKRPVFTFKERQTQLSPYASQAIQDVFTMELTMLSHYIDTVERYGVYGPYSAVIESEQTQLKLLQELAERYKVDLPNDRPAKLKLAPYAGEACQRNIESEQEKVATYKKILPRVEEYPDVYNIFNFSLNLSERGHLRVLKRCL